MQLLHAIAAAVQYSPREPVIVPAGHTQENYTNYLKELLQRQREDNDRRTILILGGTLGIIVTFICALFLYDFMHPDRGWIQKEIDRYYQSTALQAVKAWWSSLWA